MESGMRDTIQNFFNFEFLILNFIFLPFLLTGCSSPHHISRTTFVMDTVLEFTVDTRDTSRANAAMDAAVREMQRIERVFNRFDTTSLISRYNRREILDPGTEFTSLMKDAYAMSDSTHGAFDITIAPLMDAYGFGTGVYRVPSSDEIARIRNNVDYRKLLDTGASVPQTMSLKNKMMIDLNGITDGYAVDRAKKIFEHYGIHNALINLGGDVMVMGDNNGAAWKVGIQHPRRKNALIATLALKNTAVVTSGDYERYFMRNGTRYHHIIDPHTGYPAHELVSVTVVALRAEYADALSTGFFVLGKDKALACAESLDNVGVVLITSDMRVTCTTNLKPYVEVLPCDE